jgi:capsular exopolysaccharide synthesis family protein
MSVRDLRLAIWRNWPLSLGLVIVCVVAAGVYTQRVAPRYESHAQLFVSDPDPDFGIKRAASYATLATGPYVTDRVVRRLRLPETAAQLATQLTARSPGGSVLVDVTATAGDPASARTIAGAVADALVRYVPHLERGQSKARLSVSVRPTLPTARAYPDVRANLIAAAVAGVLLALLAAILRARLDRRILTPDDLPARVRDEILCVVPYDEAADRTSTAGLLSMGAARAESLRELRTELRSGTAAAQPTTIVISASIAGQGTSTIAAGLGAAMSDAGLHVILVEANLRRPSLAGRLGLAAGDGVAAELAGWTGGQPALQRVYGAPVGGGLQVLVAGAVPDNASELLSSERMPALLDALRARADVVLVDAPPVLEAAETRLLAAMADGVVLVVASGELTRDELDGSLDVLERSGARLLGVVATNVRRGGARGVARAPITARGRSRSDASAPKADVVSEARPSGWRPPPVLWRHRPPLSGRLTSRSARRDAP